MALPVFVLPSPSAKAAVGAMLSTIHRVSIMLKIRFFILFPPFRCRFGKLFYQRENISSACSFRSAR